MFLRIVPVLLFIFLFGCSSENPKATQKNSTDRGASAASSTLQTSGKPSLVFFLDPNGRPCQIQDEILRGMHGELQGVVDLRYLQTTVPSDLDYFYAFGVRGLPSLLLADSSGKEIRRLPPGVRTPEEIRVLLQRISAR